MKKFNLLFLIIVLSVVSFAQPISENLASRIAKNYITYAAAGFSNKAPVEISNQKLLLTQNQNPGVFVINFDQGGFVLVSADKRAYPVLAYSFEDSFNTDNMAPATELWISKYLEQIDIIVENNIELPNNIKILWEQIEKNKLQPVKGTRGIPALLTTKWNQDYPYNYFCPMHPAGPGGRTYAGCIATSMAQIMKYWNYPENGKGTVTYFWGDNFSVNLDTAYYEWDKMTNAINTMSRDAIAKLIFHSGIAANMNYSYDGSGTSLQNAFFALRLNFRYIPGAQIIAKSDVDDQTWKFLVKEDLDKLQPILYEGTDDGNNSHAFVCDGYQDTSFFHFNWGWGGYSDGYYYLDAINPQMSFHWGQGAIFNLKAYDSNYCNGTTYTQKEWTFDDGSGPNYYRNNTNCNWLISISDENFDFIKINFTEFNLSDDDEVKIYEGTDENGNLIETYSNLNAPSHEIISHSNNIFIKFETNSEGQADGWKIKYETVLSGTTNNYLDKINIYPNPFNDIIYFENIPQNSDLTISDISGKEIISLKNINTNKLNLSELNSGLYILTIKTDGQFKNYKIFKN